MKRKDRKMGYDRRAILTCIPSAKRKEVYAQMREDRLWVILPLIIWAVAFTGCLTLYNLITIENQYVYGIVIGVDLFIGMLMVAVYNATGTLWREPDDKEMDELGDEII